VSFRLFLSSIPAVGTFNVWANSICGILEHSGVLDPGTGKLALIGNLEQLYQDPDDSPGRWENLLQVLVLILGGEPFTSEEFVRRLQSDESLKDALPDELADIWKDGSLQLRLGHAFAARVGTWHGDSGAHLEKAGEEKRATKWRVVRG
jgi:hypothetical protein